MALAPTDTRVGNRNNTRLVVAEIAQMKGKKTGGSGWSGKGETEENANETYSLIECAEGKLNKMIEEQRRIETKLTSKEQMK